ncbi:hypothetical protein [uncultured Helicobacter sp.]|uniref:hypothetical protein n=1 Tax=uncultured Helicobacter sp. TaxID=175537 RepID=UPI00260D30F4|nr:hypothetical protein [uncultured Helicobacter sp.]
MNVFCKIPKYYDSLPYQKPILNKIRFYTPNIPKIYRNTGSISKIEAFYIEQKEIMAKISQHKIHHQKCTDCSIKNICDGFYRDFIDEFGSSAIKPIHIFTPQGNKEQISDPRFYTQYQYKVIEREEFEWFFNADKLTNIQQQQQEKETL